MISSQMVGLKSKKIDILGRIFDNFPSFFFCFGLAPRSLARARALRPPSLEIKRALAFSQKATQRELHETVWRNRERRARAFCFVKRIILFKHLFSGGLSVGSDGSATRQRVCSARKIVKDRERYAKVSRFESVQ